MSIFNLLFVSYQQCTAHCHCHCCPSSIHSCCNYHLCGNSCRLQDRKNQLWGKIKKITKDSMIDTTLLPASSNAPIIYTDRILRTCSIVPGTFSSNIIFLFFTNLHPETQTLPVHIWPLGQTESDLKIGLWLKLDHSPTCSLPCRTRPHRSVRVHTQSQSCIHSGCWSTSVCPPGSWRW